MSTMIMPTASAAEPPMPAPEIPAEEVSAPEIAADSPLDWVTLRRSGKAPFRFKGKLFASSTSYYCGSRLWYEVNIFSKNSGGYVLDLRVFKKSDEDKDIFRVTSFDSMDDVFDYLENYDPTGDVAISFDASSVDTSTSDMTLKAVSLRQSIHEATKDYRSLVGDMLYELHQHMHS